MVWQALAHSLYKEVLMKLKSDVSENLRQFETGLLRSEDSQEGQLFVPNVTKKFKDELVPQIQWRIRQVVATRTSSASENKLAEHTKTESAKSEELGEEAKGTAAAAAPAPPPGPKTVPAVAVKAVPTQGTTTGEAAAAVTVDAVKVVQPATAAEPAQKT
uniref:Uncharacterized protein n=1 Tax=Lotharella oceanica TaxID=641309 RepID=A0A7S2TZ18_9EUKA|mmetsp:Transcript_34570/g.64036  ORF Transcript_34570/g.64036 Transcript_34570/m.64036 type:complete len:160 (+) Transcript_34570:3-482(+)